MTQQRKRSFPSHMRLHFDEKFNLEAVISHTQPRSHTQDIPFENVGMSVVFDLVVKRKVFVEDALAAVNKDRVHS